MRLNKAQQQVQHFHEAFSHPVGDLSNPRYLNNDRVLVRSKWMLEEIFELLEADSITDQADALADLIYFALGTFVEMGVSSEVIFEIVHKYNMKKFGAIKKEDGKTGKPDDWVGPEQEIAEYLVRI